VLDKVKLYLSKGKIKLALEVILQIPKDLIDSEFRIDALFNLSRLVSLESKLLKGIISFENAEIIENQIKLSTIQLLEEYEFPELPTNGQAKLLDNSVIGKWICEYYDPNSQQNLKLIWQLYANNTYTEEFRKLDNSLLAKNSGTWYLLNENIYHSKDSDGLEGEGIVEWIAHDKIIFTILNSNNSSTAYSNLKKIYSRAE